VGQLEQKWNTGRKVRFRPVNRAFPSTGRTGTGTLCGL
jgi:hypothetical protein